MARRRTAATLAAAAMLLTTAPAGATAPTGPALRWGPVVTLARLAPVSRPDVVVDAAGTTTVVWSASGTVTATRRPAGGRWGPHLTIGHGVSPEAGVDAHGTVTVAWTRQRAGFGPQVMADPTDRARRLADAGGDVGAGAQPGVHGPRRVPPRPRGRPVRGGRGQLAVGCRGLRGGAGPGEVPSGRRRVGPDRHPLPGRGEHPGLRRRRRRPRGRRLRRERHRLRRTPSRGPVDRARGDRPSRRAAPARGGRRRRRGRRVVGTAARPRRLPPAGGDPTGRRAVERPGDPGLRRADRAGRSAPVPAARAPRPGPGRTGRWSPPGTPAPAPGPRRASSHRPGTASCPSRRTSR